MQEFAIEDGLERILELAQGKSEKPVLIAICGNRDSGKSFLAKRAIEKFHDKNIGRNVSYDQRYHYEHAGRYDYFFIHAASALPQEVSTFTQRFLGRPVDISVYIYNPKKEKPAGGNLKLYDVVIQNPEAVPKNSSH